MSTKKEEQDGSFEEQKKYYENLIRSNSDWEFAGHYCERVSATHMDDRPVFKQMVRDAIDEKVDLILCKSLSRWARNTVDALETIQILKSQGVRIVFEEDSIDTDEYGMIMRVAMGSAIAQQESRSISENIKWIYKHRAEKGVFIPHRGKYFGFSTDAGFFIENSDADYVRLIFKEFAAGASMAGIARELNGLGLKTTAGKEWKRESVRKILTNEVYVGDVSFPRKAPRDVITGKKNGDYTERYLENHHGGIVDRGTWESVQQRLAAQKKETGHKGAGYEPLDDRVWELINQGLSGTEIANALNISIGVEKGCVRRLKTQERLSGRGYDRIDGRKRAALELIKNHPDIIQRDIQKSLCLSRQNTDYAVKKLAEERWVQKDVFGSWQVIEKDDSF